MFLKVNGWEARVTYVKKSYGWNSRYVCALIRITASVEMRESFDEMTPS